MSRLKLHADKFLLFIILLQIFYQFIETVMGFKSLVLILIFAILSVSCSTINFATQQDIAKRDYSMFNYLGSKHNSKIFLLNGEEIAAEYVFVKNDSLYYVAVLDTLSVPLTTIERVEISQLGKNIAYGLIVGVLSFIVSSVALSKVIVLDGGFGNILTIPFAAGLGVAGLILGLNYGGKSEYIFHEVNHKNDEVKIRQMENYKKRIEYFKEKAKQDSTNLDS